MQNVLKSLEDMQPIKVDIIFEKEFKKFPSITRVRLYMHNNKQIFVCTFNVLGLESEPLIDIHDFADSKLMYSNNKNEVPYKELNNIRYKLSSVESFPVSIKVLI